MLATTNTKSSYAIIALVQCLTAVQNHMATQYDSVRRMETPINRPYDAARDLFRKYFDSLVDTAIEPVYLDVANKLYANGWISPFEDVPGETSKQAASRIVREVERQLM